MIALLILALTLALSWIIACGIICLITLCFGLEFSWLMATGIWLVLLLVRGVLKVTIKKE